MKNIFKVVLAVGLLVTFYPLWAQAEPPLEGATSFYVWQGDIPQQAGQLLRQENLEPHHILENAATGVRILYASQGWDERWIAVSGDVLIPKGDAPEGGWPVLAWSHGTVGVADICAPSYNGRSPRDIAYLNKWLAEGYAFYLLLQWFGADLGFWQATMIFVFATLAGGLTGAPGGVGGAEAAMIALLYMDGIGPEIAIPATAVIRLTTLWFAILIGLAIFPHAEARSARAQTKGAR